MTATPEPAETVGRPTSGSAGASAGLDALPCGVPVAALVDQVDSGQLEPADAHQLTCAHCRQALRAAAVVDQAVGLLRATSGPVPGGLVERVLRRVRDARRDPSLIELPAEEQGAGRPMLVSGGVRVRRQVVADIARAAATALRGVTVAQAAARPRPGAPGAVEITLGLLVDGRTPLPELARRVRETVRQAVRRALGPTEVQVELTALDLLDLLDQD